MIKKFSVGTIILLLFLVVIASEINCTNQEKDKGMTQAQMVAQGKYLVNSTGCNDCHSPKIMTPMGPIPDSTKLLSGHPADEKLPEFDNKLISEKHVYIFSADLTAFAGPWGVSYSANLTPDSETGSGAWQEDMFINAIRNGKHLGIGRPILPPMPWMSFKNLTDEDLKSIFAYLKTLTPIKNKVPDPAPTKM